MRSAILLALLCVVLGLGVVRAQSPAAPPLSAAVTQADLAKLDQIRNAYANAHSILTDERKRATYDRELAGGELYRLFVPGSEVVCLHVGLKRRVRHPLDP